MLCYLYTTGEMPCFGTSLTVSRPLLEWLFIGKPLSKVQQFAGFLSFSLDQFLGKTDGRFSIQFPGVT
jgi:hypothetical protein